MGYPTKVQLIERKESQQWYINFLSVVQAKWRALFKRLKAENAALRAPATLERETSNQPLQRL